MSSFLCKTRRLSNYTKVYFVQTAEVKPHTHSIKSQKQIAIFTFIIVFIDCKILFCKPNKEGKREPHLKPQFNGSIKAHGSCQEVRTCSPLQMNEDFSGSATE